MKTISKQIKSALYLVGLVVITLSASARSTELAESPSPLDSSYITVTTGIPYGYGWWGWGYGYPIYGYSFVPYYPQRFPTYGAISYSVSAGLFGGSWGFNYYNDAISSANAGCGVEDCRTVVWVQGGCAAVATSGPETRRLGWSYADSRYMAESYALQNCRAGGVAGCKVQAWVCSF